MKIRTDMKRHQGFSLIELMIALTISMLLLLGLAVIYERNSSTRYEVERNSRQLENGRYALNLLAGDIRLAGYLSSFTNIPVPTLLPTSPCSTDIAVLKDDFNVYLQGFDNGSGGLSCLPDYRGGDVIVVRRASACSAANPAETDCAPLTAGLPYLQASGCSTDPVAYRLETNLTNLTLRKVGCTNTASIHRFYTHIYYVANNNLPGDGIPTLKRWELGNSANPVALVEGIENVQYEYGIDNNNDGSPDSYTSDPSTVANWNNVVTVKIHLLSRNETRSPGHTDSKFYMLGGTRVPASGTFGDAFRRHVFSTTVMVENPAGRRQ